MAQPNIDRLEDKLYEAVCQAIRSISVKEGRNLSPAAINEYGTIVVARLFIHVVDLGIDPSEEALEADMVTVVASLETIIREALQEEP